MLDKNWISRGFLTAIGALLSALAGCGGSSSGSEVALAEAKVPEGLYSTALTGSTNPTARFLVLEDGQYWSLYGADVGGSFLVGGFAQGNGVASGGKFTSSNLRDYYVTPAVAGTLSASYNATATTISGSITFPTGSVSFNGDAVASSTFNYNTQANSASIAGNWVLGGQGSGTVPWVIAANGSATALTGSGCAITGSFLPRPSGKNVFNVTINFGPAPCSVPGLTMAGVAITYPIAGSLTQLLVTVVDGSRGAGVPLFGTR
jgi:hypothetical protein